MKCPFLFSGEKLKNITSVSAELPQRVLMVKLNEGRSHIW